MPQATGFRPLRGLNSGDKGLPEALFFNIASRYRCRFKSVTSLLIKATVTFSRVVDPVLLNQEIALAKFHVGACAVIRRRVDRAEGALALGCVLQAIPIKPTGARRVRYRRS